MVKEGWHYLAVKSLSPLLRQITSKHHSTFYCLDCFHSMSTEKTWISSKVCKNIDFCNVVIPSEDTKILDVSQNEKYATFIIYVEAIVIVYTDLKCLIEKIDGCKTHAFTTKVSKHIP